MERKKLLDPGGAAKVDGTPKNGAGKGKKDTEEGIFDGYSPGKLRFDPEGARQVERIRIVRDLGKRGRRQTSWIGTRRIAQRVADKG